MTTRRRHPRVGVSITLLILDIAILGMTVGELHGPIRFVLGLILALVIPGWSVVGLLELDNSALEISLTIAVSLSMLMILAQLLIAFQLWHLVGFQVVMCLVCLPSLAWQSVGLGSAGQYRR